MEMKRRFIFVLSLLIFMLMAGCSISTENIEPRGYLVLWSGESSKEISKSEMIELSKTHILYKNPKVGYSIGSRMLLRADVKYVHYTNAKGYGDIVSVALNLIYPEIEYDKYFYWIGFQFKDGVVGIFEIDEIEFVEKEGELSSDVVLLRYTITIEDKKDSDFGKSLIENGFTEYTGEDGKMIYVISDNLNLAIESVAKRSY